MTDTTRMQDTPAVSPPVETLPLTERVKLAESVNPYNGIAPGWFIDARDTINNWCVAEVLKVEGNDVKTLRLRSYKICPFRLASKGYTGQIKIPLRRYTFSLPQLSEARKKLDEVLSTEFQCLSTAFEVTQYLRGKLYTYVDFLMTGEYKHAEEVTEVIGFLKQVVRLIALWVKFFPRYLRSFMEVQSHPKLILVDRNAAFAAAGYEMLDMLKWMFCLSHRTLVFFERYDVEIEPHEGKYVKPLEKEFVPQRDKNPSINLLIDRLESGDDFVYGLFINFFNIFCTCAGIDSVLSIISPEHFAKHAATIPGYKLPVDVIASWLAPFKSIRPIADPGICQKLVEAGREMFFRRVEGLEEKDIKDVSKETITAAMSHIKGILMLVHGEEEAGKIVQGHEMMISLRFIQSASLEKRLNGLGDIKKLIDRVEYGSRFTYQPIAAGTKDSWFTAEYLGKWIIEQKVMEAILNENAHAELVRRSVHILIFLAKKKMLSASMLELLWKCQYDKHEDIIRGVYDAIRELIEYLSLDDVKYIFTKIKAIPLEKYDEKLLTFMKDFTLKAYTIHVRDKRFEKMEDIEPSKEGPSPKPPELQVERAPDGSVIIPSAETLFCTPIFWSLLQDDSAVPLEFHELITAGLKEMVADTFCAPYRLQYAYLCMENLKTHKSVPQSLLFLIYILSLVNSQQFIHKSTVKDWLGVLSKDYPIVQLVLQSFERYFAEVSKGPVSVEDACPATAIFVGKLNHTINIESRLKLLYNYLNHGPKDAKMGSDGIRALWGLFIGGDRPVSDSETFLKWIGSEKEVQGHVVPAAIFNREETGLVFDMICKGRDHLARKYDMMYFKCFGKNFKLVNSLNGSVEIKKGKPRVLKLEAVVGLDSVWENVCFAPTESLRGKFTELLIDVYNNLAESPGESKRKETLTLFLNRCMSEIMKSDQEPVITNVSKVLLAFFGMLDGEKYKDPDDTDLPFHRYIISVTLQPGNVARKFEVGIDVTVGQLRKKIADEFGIPFSGFHLVGKTRVYEAEENDALLRSIGWSQQMQAKRVAGTDSEFNPKVVIAENHDYITHLFLLLSKESATYVEPVWELLMTLPPDRKMLTDIRTLAVPETGWDSLLDTTSVHKFLYALQIIEQTVTPPADMEDTLEVEIGYKRWIVTFCKKEGVGHLFNAFIKLPIASLQNALTRKCFGLLLKVLYLIQAAGYPLDTHVPKYEAAKGIFLERTLAVLDSFAQHSIVPESVKAQQRALKKQKSTKPGTEAEDSAEKSQTEQKAKKKQDEESKAFEYAFALIKGPKGSVTGTGYFEQMVKVDCFKDLLLKGLILSDNPYLKHSLAQELLLVCKSCGRQKEYPPSHPYVVLLPFMLQVMVRETLHRDSNPEQFYQLLCALLRDVPKSALPSIPLNFHDLFTAFSQYLAERPVVEHTSRETDNILVGLLKTLQVLLENFPSEREFVGQTCGVITQVLHKCLFEFATVAKQNRLQAPPPPKCKSQPARLGAFNLLCVLVKDCPANLIQVVKYLVPIHAKGAWRTKRGTDWNIMPESGEKSTTGYVGLKNLGCTCYMNSLLQQLYMIPTLRNDVLAVEDPKRGTVNPEENLLYQTQCLFAALNESVKQCYNPKLFCHAFKDWDNKSINVLEQMDVDEFLNLFMDKVETLTKGTPQAKTIKSHFGGVFANQLLCKDCPHSSVRDEPFLALNLQVKNKKSLQQCLESFVEGEMLQGNNAYHCEKCDKKVTTLKRVCIKRLPRHLIFVLKRFDINYDTMQKFKINDYCEFPMRFCMEPFTAEGLAKKDYEKEREKAKKEGRDLDDLPSQPGNTKKYPPEYYDYKLTGVVIHMGTADVGHYYSLIADREKEWLPEKERWYEFNDTFVNQYNPEEIKDDAFGGEEKIHGFEGFSFRPMEKSRNAYLLVYERASAYDPPEDSAENEEDGAASKEKMVVKPGIVAAVPEDIHAAIIQDNIKYWYSKYMFHEDYFEFALGLCTTWNSISDILKTHPSKNLDYHLLGLTDEIAKSHGFQHLKRAPEVSAITPILKESPRYKEAEFEVFKYAATLVFTTLFRAHNKMVVPEFVDLLKAHMNKNVESARWLLSQFCNKKVLGEFLFECAEGDVRRLVVGLLYCGMLKVYATDKSCDALLANFANGLFHQLPSCRKYTIYFEQFFQLFSRLASIGPEIRQYLLKVGGLRHLLGFWGSIAETAWSEFKDLAFEENVAPEIGLSSEVDDRFQSPFEEYFSAKRDKLCQNAQPPYTFLIEAVAILLRGTTFDEKAPVSKSALPGCVPGLGMEPVVKTVLSIKNVNEMIKDCRNPISVLELVKAWGHLGWENPEFKMLGLKAIMQGMNLSEYDDLHKYFVFFKELLAIEDPGQGSFVPVALSELDTMMKNNQQAFLATVISIRHMLWVAKEIPAVGNWYKANVEQWEWIITWLKENPCLTYGQGTLRAYKSKVESMKAVNRYDSNFAPETQAKWRNHTKWLEQNAEKVKQGKANEVEVEVDHYVTLYYDKFFKDQVIEYHDGRTMGWARGVIIRVLDEMVYLRPEDLSERYAEWVEIDSPNIAHEGTHVKEKPMVRDLNSSDDSPIKMDSEDDD